MERMTRIDECGCVTGVKKERGSYYGHVEMIERLKEYEDIGLPPEEITDILAVICESADDVDDLGISTGILHDLLELAQYRKTGETPNTITNLSEIARRQSDSIIKLGLKLEDIEKERDLWESEAKKWCDQSFEYRILTEGSE